MTIFIFGLIFNNTEFSNLSFADDDDEEKSSKEQQRESKSQKEESNEEREQQRESKSQKEESNEEREQQRESKSQKEESKEERGIFKEFAKDAVVKSSSSSSVGKITICHIPPGNVENAHTITVGNSALRAHLAHNDVIGSCDDADLSGINDINIKESRIAERDSNKESKALERSQKLIDNLEQQITKLEQRLQHLIEKYHSGEYFGNLSSMDENKKSYTIDFKGTASSIYDETVTTEMSGKLFMENQAISSNTSKFKIVSGEIIVGNNVYDVVFGKARSSSSGDEVSLVLIMQTIDSVGNENTIKITSGFGSLDDDIGDSPQEFEIMENSTISQQWTLEGNGELRVNS